MTDAPEMKFETFVKMAERIGLWVKLTGRFKGPFTPSVSVNAVKTLVIVFSLKTMKSLQNRFATHFEATPLFSMRTESQASSQI